MPCMRLASGLLLLLALAAPGHCKATRWWRAVPGDRVIDGAFSPRDSSIAYVRYGTKRFSADGASFAFDVVIGVKNGGRQRDLLTMHPEQPGASGSYTREPEGIRWLPSERYLLASMGPWGWLVKADGSLHTKVALHGDWYVTNDELDLSWHDMMSLRAFLREWNPMAGLAQPWLYDRTGNVRVLNRSEADHIWIRSPDRRHVLYKSGPSGDPLAPFGPEQGVWLWVTRTDGQGKRRVVRIGSGRATWLDSEWLAYWPEPLGGPWPCERQIGIFSIHTGGGQVLTSGPYYHTLRDYRNGRFLITEEPVEERATYASRLYVIEPLRVRL